MKLNKCIIQKNGDKTKISTGAKCVAEFGKKNCQLNTTCGTNVKLLVASFGFTKKYRIIEVYLKFFVCLISSLSLRSGIWHCYKLSKMIRF